MLPEIILLLAGLYLIVGVAIFNIGMQGRRAQRMVRFIGVAGTKIVYIIMGLAFTTVSILSFIGVINLG